MKHIIISDTHSPQCAEKAYSMLADFLPNKPDIDAIVVNGDLLGIFSMASSCLHKGTMIPKEQMMAYLQAAAPRFYKIFMQTGQVTPELATQFVAERYLWAAKMLEKFAKLRMTFFNMGNHESPLHFLVLRELTFLTGCDRSIPDQINKNKLEDIFKAFEYKLRQMEKKLNFRYLRKTPLLMGETLVLGIPGESHDTSEEDFHSQKQEENTANLIKTIEPALQRATSIIIYNHTQGKYNRSTGEFECASKSLADFMKNMPENIKTKIFVQSHNHWSHTQFFEKNGFHFVMNNAGLHAGIFNAIALENDQVKCFDLDPNENRITPLKLFTSDNNLVIDDEDVIARNYPEPEYVIKRKNTCSAISLT